MQNQKFQFEIEECKDGTYEMTIPGKTLEETILVGYVRPTCAFRDYKNLIEKSPVLKELAELGYNLSAYAAASKEKNTPEFLVELLGKVQEYQDRYIELMASFESNESKTINITVTGTYSKERDSVQLGKAIQKEMGSDWYKKWETIDFLLIDLNKETKNAIVMVTLKSTEDDGK